MANTVLLLCRGDQAYLIPKTLGCARACWSQPKVTIVSTADRPMLTVRLPDGTEISVHEDNVVREINRKPRPQRAPAPRRPIADGEEVPLW